MRRVSFLLAFTLLAISTKNVQSQGVDVYHVIIAPGSDPRVQGQLTVAEVKEGVTIRGQITGLGAGPHGFHIHEKGVLTNDCKDAGPHFNPFQKSHGHPRDEHRHVGDLGNIEADLTGVALIDILDRLTSLNPSSPEIVANVRIVPGSGQAVRGNLKIQEVPGGVTIKGFISGLTPGPHGFHIHEKGDLGDQCKNALGHFNPFKSAHGDPTDPERHVGDLGNIIADSSGVAHIDIYDPLASFNHLSQAYIGDRAIVVHAKPDDLGRGGDAESLKTGNAGARVGCGVIRVNDAIFFPIAERPVPTFHQQRRHRQTEFPSFIF